MDRSEIYSLKLYKFTQVDSANDVRPSMNFQSKIVCSSDTYLYLHRCLNVREYNPSFPEIWRYNFSKRKWSPVYRWRSLPGGTGCCESTLSGDILFLRYCTFGNDSSTDARHTLYFCNLSKCNVTMNDCTLMMQPISTRTAGNELYPPQYGGCAMAVHGGCLYLVGGASMSTDRGRVYSMDVWEFCMETRQWTRLYDSAAPENCDGPEPRFRHEMVYHNHELYIFGGHSETLLPSLRILPVFNLGTNTWNFRETEADPEGNERFPSCTGLHSIARNPHQPAVVFVHGGCNDRISIPSFNNTWRINLDTLQWKSVPSSVADRGLCQHSMSCTPDGRLYLFGGRTERGIGKFLVAWTVIPKLTDISWDALIFYVSKGVIKLPNDLRTLQIPEKYLNRLLYD